MATANKTAYTDVDVHDFLTSFVAKEQKRDEAVRLMELMGEWSGFQPRMFGPSIIGFGDYHYKYESGREGDVPIVAFSPRKSAFTLYVFVHDEDYGDLFDRLGKIKMTKGCIYFNKLADLNLDVLEQICRLTVKRLG